MGNSKLDIVFVLGAGASYEAGVPLMNNFFDRSRLVYSSYKLDSKISGDFDKVFGAINLLQSSHSKAALDIYNLEAVFTAFEFAQLLQTKDEIFNEDLVMSLKRLIAVTIHKSLKFIEVNTVYGIAPPKAYQHLVESIQEYQKLGCTVSVISFNYDVALDFAFLNAGVEVDYCLNIGRKGGKAVTYLKPHGSMHWRRCTGCKRVFPLELNKYFYNARRHHPGASREFVEIGVEKANLEHLEVDNKTPCQGKMEEVCYLVPPSWNKQGYYHAISPIWVEAAKILGAATSIFVCGYSLPATDQFFHNLYALGTMGGKPLHCFQVYNPDESGETEVRFKRLIGTGAIDRFKYVSGHLGKFSMSVHEIHKDIKKLLS